MFPLGLQVEKMVKGRHSIDLAERYSQSSGDVMQGLAVEIAKRFLYCVQAFDEGMRLASVAAHGGLHQSPTTIL
jgi:hypothetical protein